MDYACIVCSTAALAYVGGMGRLQARRQAATASCLAMPRMCVPAASTVCMPSIDMQYMLLPELIVPCDVKMHHEILWYFSMRSAGILVVSDLKATCCC